MNENERKVMFSEVYELLDIIGENFTDELSLGTGSNVDFQKVKNCYLQMIDSIITDETENNSLKTWLDNSDFWIAPASTKFHGNFKGGLSLHTLMVIKQSLIFTRPLLENFYQSPNASKFQITTKDILERFGVPDVIWLGTPCQSYSIAAISHHRRKNEETGRNEFAG